MLRWLLLIIPLHLLFYAGGGYFALFRTARNERLRPPVRLGWMLAQSLLPELALMYFLVVEQARRMRLLGLLSVLIALALAVPWLLLRPTDPLADRISAGLAPKPAPPPSVTRAIEAAERRERDALPEDAQRLHDDLSREAETLNRFVVAQFNAPKSADQKEALDEANIALTRLRWSYLHVRLAEPDYARLLSALEQLVTRREIAPDEEREWEHEVDTAVDHARAQMLAGARATHPEGPARQPEIVRPVAEERRAQTRLVGELLAAEDWDGLDVLADRLRSEDSRFPGGDSRLSAYYAALGRRGLPPEQFAAREAAFNAWHLAHPDSAPARIAMARLQIAHAWDLRGGEYRDARDDEYKTSQSGNAAFVAGYTRAYAAIQGLDPEADPEIYRILLEMGYVTGSDGRADIDRLYARAIRRFPTYFPYYPIRAQQLHCCYGKPGEEAAYLRALLDHPDPRIGQPALVHALMRARADFSGIDLMRAAHLSWPRVQAAFAGAEQLYGANDEELNGLMALAEDTGDRAVTVRAADRIGPWWNAGFFASETSFAAAARWARGGAGPADSHE